MTRAVPGPFGGVEAQQTAQVRAAQCDGVQGSVLVAVHALLAEAEPSGSTRASPGAMLSDPSAWGGRNRSAMRSALNFAPSCATSWAERSEDALGSEGVGPGVLSPGDALGQDHAPNVAEASPHFMNPVVTQSREEPGR